MVQPGPLTFLLANERAEEIKSATLSMRGFYPGCRVEAVYSAAEALDYAAKEDWHVIVLDEQLSDRTGLDILPDLRKRAPGAGIILQAGFYDTPIALQALGAGADHCLCKTSPAFLTELPLAMKQMLDKRELRLGLGLALERYCRLTESLDGVVYELDASGRFVSVSPMVTVLLGYRPDEMIGIHYTAIVHPQSKQDARYRLNERRTAARATRHFVVRLVAKHWPHEADALLDAEVTAAGLYAQNTYMGTIGVLRSLRDHTPGGREPVAPGTAPLSTMAPPASAAVTTGMPAAPQAADRPARTGPAPAPEATAPSVSDKPQAPAIERRKSARVDLLAEACLREDDCTHPGVALNISHSGLYMIFNERISAAEHQAIHVGLVSGPALLELRGRIREVRAAVGGDDAVAHTGLAVEFQISDAPDELVLASLLEELRERSISITVTASLTPAGPTDLRFQTESVTHADWAPAGPTLRDSPEFTDTPGGLSGPSDYWRLLGHVHRLVGDLEGDQQILDAGCGNGAFAAFLLIQDAYRLRLGSGRNLPRARYVGVDSPVLARQSKTALDLMAGELRRYLQAAGTTVWGSSPSFCSADLDRTLPFRNDQFDRIVCNLLMGYLRDPLVFLRELMRVLAPAGLLVLTSLNPRAENQIRFTGPMRQGDEGGTERLWGSLVHLKPVTSPQLLGHPLS